MANPGIAPPDQSTDVGKFRRSTNDLAYVELDPPVSGQGDYTINSDEDIEGYIEQGGDSLNRGIGYYFLYLSGQAAIEAVNIKDTDLAANTEKRSELLAKVAQDWFDLADKEDIANGDTDLFDTFIFRSDENCQHIELSACPVDCRC